MDQKKRVKVVPIEAWREARVIEENLDMGLFYQSLIGCTHEEKAKEETGYCVVVYSVPAEDIPDEEFFYTLDQRESFTVIKDGNVGEFAPMNEQGVERYEFYDVTTDDVHVLYRIPFKLPS